MRILNSFALFSALCLGTWSNTHGDEKYTPSKEISRAVAQLDYDEFKVREKATNTLVSFGNSLSEQDLVKFM